MLRTLFGKPPKEREAPRIAKAQRGIRFDPSLITALTHQHRELVMLLVKASSSAEQCYYAEATEALAQFKANLDAHLKRESAQLIPYLSQHLWGEGSDELIREMQAHGARIERDIKSFLASYLEKPVDASSLQHFLIDIDHVCDEFSQAAGREEALFYSLYMGPEAY